MRQGTPGRQKEWGLQNPPQQKFTKTDLAKYEHAWLGLPHIVCKGAEKNFDAFATRLEDDGEPVIDRLFFENVVARAILWRSTERIFDSLDVEGYRANTVAYTVAWLAEWSNRRLDLAQIWRDQRLSPEVSEALLTVCKEAYKFLKSCPGNIGEASKKPDTWTAFRETQIEIGNLYARLRENGADGLSRYPEKKPNAEVNAARSTAQEISADDWFGLAKWAKDRGFLEGWERKLAFSMGRLATQGKTLTDKQAVQAARIMNRARELGFSTGA
jgi:hypothetical protein